MPEIDVLAPHIGNATRQARLVLAALALPNLAAVFDGAPLPSPVPECR